MRGTGKGKGKGQSGFTLIEVAIALLLIGLLLGGALSTTRFFSQQVDIQAQSRAMQTIQTALTTYLKVNRFLPCPDTDEDGWENRRASKGLSVCRKRSGTLPYKTLGVNGKDKWGNAYYYYVNPRAINAQYITDVCQTASVFGRGGPAAFPTGFGFCPASQSYYCDDCSQVCASTCTFGTQTPLKDLEDPPYYRLFSPPTGVDKAGKDTNSHKNAWFQDVHGEEVQNSLALVVVSFGENGRDTWRDCRVSSVFEQENCDGDAEFTKFRTSEQALDFVMGLNVYDIKRALLESGAYSEQITN